jgi:hypothetical protein
MSKVSKKPVLKKPVSKKQRVLRWLGYLALAGVGLTGLWLITLNLLAQQLDKQLDQAFQEMEQQFPQTEPNATAKQLDATIAQLGLDLRSPQASSAVRSELTAYLEGQLDTLDDSIAAPPQTVQNFIRQHQGTLDATIKQLNQAEIPNWGFSSARRSDLNAEIPRGLTNSTLFQQLLLVDSFVKMRDNNTAGALAAVDAAWKVNQGVAQDPSLIGQLFKTVGLKQQAIALRKLKNVPAVWGERLASRQKSESIAFLNAVQMEQFMAARMLRDDAQLDALQALEGEIEPGTFQHYLFWSLNALMKPYWRVSVADIALKTPQMKQPILAQDVCAFEPAAIQQQSDKQLAWWNHPDRLGVPMMDVSTPIWPRINQHVMHLQLTQKVLQAKASALKAGKLPSSIPGIETSLCQNTAWRYQVGKDGQATIDFPDQANFAGLRGNKKQGDRLQHRLSAQGTPSTPLKSSTPVKPKVKPSTPVKPNGKL